MSVTWEVLAAEFAVITVALSKAVLLVRILLLLEGVKLTAANKVATWELIEGGANVEPEPIPLATPIWITPAWVYPSLEINALVKVLVFFATIMALPPVADLPSASTIPWLLILPLTETILIVPPL